jgi:hypothetical protein
VAGRFKPNIPTEIESATDHPMQIRFSSSLLTDINLMYVTLAKLKGRSVSAECCSPTADTEVLRLLV